MEELKINCFRIHSECNDDVDGQTVTYHEYGDMLYATKEEIIEKLKSKAHINLHNKEEAKKFLITEDSFGDKKDEAGRHWLNVFYNNILYSFSPIDCRFYWHPEGFCPYKDSYDPEEEGYLEDPAEESYADETTIIVTPALAEMIKKQL